MQAAADFEEPLVELRRRIVELEGFPPGGARDKELARLRRRPSSPATRNAPTSTTATYSVISVLGPALDRLAALGVDELLARRYARFRCIGAFVER